MKLKSVQRTANVAWSPASHYPVYLAAGTAAQQLDATFSTKASLELYHMNLNHAGNQMELAGEIETDSRFYKLVWGAYGMDSKTSVSGLLMGGAEQGQLYVWDAAKIISGEDPLVYLFDKHCGPVTTLDINPFQKNLVASGASESEIFIWDLNSTEKPMTPGNKAQPAHDVTCLAWNQQVQHILASSHGGNCIVWDLRKNEPIIKIRDSMSHIKCGVICWHPEVATQICIASEDDHTPVIQLWDLRSATSPLRVSENHQRGILSMSWCPSDPDLLMSSGKDNRILCWNPNSESKIGEVVYELPTGDQWSFDVQWCPRNPAVISSCSFDGHITLHSIMGDSSDSSVPTSLNGTASFDPFPQSVSQYGGGDATLKKPPKWMRRPVGASFAFGGKLISFENVKVVAVQPHVRPSRSVNISQVVTETELVSRSIQLEQTLADGYYTKFCEEKIEGSTDLSESTVWSFLKVNFEPDARENYLKLLGYTHTAVKEQVRQSLKTEHNQSKVKQDEHHADDAIGLDNVEFSAVPSIQTDSTRLTISVGNEADGLITQSLLTANFEAAVDVCLNHGRMAEALVLSIAGGPELLARTQEAFFDANKSNVDRLMWAIVTQNFESVVQTCDLSNWKEALAIILTYTAGEKFTSLCNKLGRRLETECEGEFASNAHICYIVAGNVDQLVACWSQVVGDDMSYQTLQDLIEKVMVLKNGTELSMKGLTSSGGNGLGEKLSRYADVLASQGCIKTAMNYVRCASQEDRSIAVLVDRLYQSLGIYDDNVKFVRKPFGYVNVVSAASRQLPVAAPVTMQQHKPVFDSTVQHNTDASYLNNSYTGAVSANTRIRHDSNPVDTNRILSSQQVSNSMPLSKGLSKKYGIVQPATQEQHSSNYFNYQQQQSQTSSQLYPGNTFPYSTPSNTVPYSPPELHSASVTANSSVYPTYQPSVSASSSVYPAYQPSTGAWNDPPPIVQDTIKPYIDYSTNSSGFEGTFLNPADYKAVSPPVQESYVGKAIETPSVQNKLPLSKLPEEHQILQHVFHQLVQVCSAAGSHNTQVKKKLEEILKKLDYLFSQLINRKLSATTVDGLHRIVIAIQQFDYQTALCEHAHIVSVGSFTEISQFMPAIKVLIQTAMQLQVYV